MFFILFLSNFALSLHSEIADMEKIRLQFKGISEISDSDNAGIIMLTDLEEKREITVICDNDTIHQFELRITKQNKIQSLLPEVLVGMMKSEGILNYELIINDINIGEYVTVLFNETLNKSVNIKTTDAILLSYVSNIPLYITDQLMKKQSIPYKTSTINLALPINTLNEKMLEKALDKAVQDEKYEMASILRDEINRRKSKNDKQENTNERN